jgi:hypothetical protein
LFDLAFLNLVPRHQVFELLVGGRSAYEEPLVDARVDGSRSKVLALGNVELARVGTIRRVGNGYVGTASVST